MSYGNYILTTTKEWALLRWRIIMRSMGLIILIYLLSVVDVARLFDHLLKADVLLIVLAVLLRCTGWAVKAVKWDAVNRFMGIRVSIGRQLIAVVATDFLASLSPGRVGELAKIAYLTHIANSSKILSALLVDRITDIISLFIIGTFSLAFLSLNQAIGINRGALFVTIIILIALLTIIPLCRNLNIDSRISNLSHLEVLPNWISKGLIRFSNVLKGVQSISIGASLLLSTWSFPNWFLTILRAYVLAMAIGLDIPLVFLSALIVAVTIIKLLPVTVMGIGTRDVLFIAALGVLGIEAEQALSYSFLFVASQLIEILISFVVWHWSPPDV